MGILSCLRSVVCVDEHNRFAITSILSGAKRLANADSWVSSRRLSVLPSAVCHDAHAMQIAMACSHRTDEKWKAKNSEGNAAIFRTTRRASLSNEVACSGGQVEFAGANDRVVTRGVNC